MQLKDYFPQVSKKYNRNFFSGISFDSKKIKKNNIFFAIKGNKIDGNNFVKDAIKRGSKVIVTEKNLKNLKMEFYILPLKIFENY